MLFKSPMPSQDTGTSENETTRCLQPARRQPRPVWCSTSAGARISHCQGPPPQELWGQSRTLRLRLAKATDSGAQVSCL